MRTAAGNNEWRCPRARAQFSTLGFCRKLRMATGPGPIGLVQRRRMHHAEHRRVALDQGDVHGELAVALDELARAVERIDEKIPLPATALAPVGVLSRILAQ